jgi:hypothetical protein
MERRTMLYGSENIVFWGALVAAVIGLFGLSFPRMPTLYFRHTAGLGLARVAVAAGLAWTAYVLWNHADPSVVGVYRPFYLVIALACILWFGPAAARAMGVRFQQDVVERHNLRAAWILAAMMLATGLIFGGSVWGDADPGGDGEGGWWIPMGFFLSGWSCLVVAAGLYAWRDGHGSLRRLRRRRDPRDAAAPALYLLSAGAVLTESVAGDFYGWTEGLTVVGAIGGMLIGRELIALVAGRAGSRPALRIVESSLYVLWSAGFWLISRGPS